MPTASRPHNFEDVIDKVPGVKQSGNNWNAPCPLPGHKTPAGHLTLKDAGDKALVICQGGRHVYQDYCQAWGWDSLSYSTNGTGGSSSYGKACYPVIPPPKQVQKGITPPLLTGVIGVSLNALAEAKHLPVDFLKSLGVADVRGSSQPSVKIPYYSEAGQEVAVRIRAALSGANRFKWRKGDHAMPYGLNRLDNIKKAGWVLIVEGESDCWTGWFHNIPAIGAPGKSIWPPAWGEYLKGLDVFVWQEPGAEDFTLRVLASAPGLRFIPAPDGIKDINEAHIQGLDVPAWMEGLKTRAKSGQGLKQRHDNELLAQLYTEAKVVLEAPDPLEVVREAIRGQGYGGDLKPTLIIYLSATSRLLEMRNGAMPVHLLILGPASSGKSYALSVVKSLLPAEAVHTIDAGSARTVIYDDTPLEHKVLIFGEADSLPAGEDNPAASAIRNLLQDHCLHYSVTVRDEDTGDFRVREINKPGPTTLITTSTRSLGDQLMTRLFTLEIACSKEQIGAALVAQAAVETEGVRPIDSGLVAFQAYLQLKAPVKVSIPFVTELGEAMAKMAQAPRIQRDFARLISLVKTVTLIRQASRQTDGEGRLVATLSDYETVRELVNAMYIDSSTGATNEIRRLVEAVRLLGTQQVSGNSITNTTLAKHLDIGQVQANRRAKKAMKEGWIVNREQRKSYPADYAPGEPMPETEGLPVLTGVNTANTDNNEHVNDFSHENRIDNRITPLNVSDAPPTLNDHHEVVLGIPVEEVLEFWRSEGAQVIHLVAGENCTDLEILLSNPDCSERHLKAVKRWLIDKKKLVPGTLANTGGGSLRGALC